MNYLILGAGATGQSVLRHCQQFGINATILDDGKSPTEIETILNAYPTANSYDAKAHHFEQFDIVIKSPGISPKHPIIQQIEATEVPIWGDIDLFCQHNTRPIIAITGSNGKTTVTQMIGPMLSDHGYKAQTIGNIGHPVLDYISQSDNPDFFVLEVSSYQLEHCQHLNAKVGAVLNITPDHLQRYEGCFDRYRATKLKLFDLCEKKICNRAHHSSESNPDWISFGLDQPNDHHFGVHQYNNLDYFFKGDTALWPTNILASKPYPHTLANAAAAMAAIDALNLPLAPIEKTLKQFTPDRHRLQIIRKHRHVRWINDSKATNVGATCAAVEAALSDGINHLILLLGGQSKGGDWTPLIQRIKNHNCLAICFGQDGATISETLKKANIEQVVYPTLDEAVQQAKQISTAGDCVLLSPGCASFDHFQGYADRGDHFIHLVLGLKA